MLCVFPYVQGARAVMKEEAAENKSRLQKARGGSCVILGIHGVILGCLRQKMTKRGDISGRSLKTVVCEGGSRTTVIRVFLRKITVDKNPRVSENEENCLKMWLLLQPTWTNRPRKIVTFYSCALTLIQVRHRLRFILCLHRAVCTQQTSSRTQVYSICVVQCSFLWTSMIFKKFSQCILSVRKIWKCTGRKQVRGKM